MLSIPLFTIISAIVLDSHKGKKEILKFDFVQFVYSFVLAPVFFIWLKSFFYYLLRDELGLRLSNTSLFVYDTVLSVGLFYVFAFVVIHSLTKSFEIKQTRDPLHDLFAHSEYFHQEFSHFVVFLGSMGVLTFVSLANVFVPLIVDQDRLLLYALSGFGIVVGMFLYYGIGLFETKSVKFHKLMKLGYGVFFLTHVLAYFFTDVSYHLAYGPFWLIFFMSSTLVASAFFVSFEKYPARFVDTVIDTIHKSLRFLKIKILN